jgi:hypothetical protein
VLAIAVIDAAGQPPLLPVIAFLGAQPAQHPADTVAAFPLHRSVIRPERAWHQPAQQRLLLKGGGQPGGRNSAGRELRAQPGRRAGDGAGLHLGAGLIVDGSAGGLAEDCHDRGSPKRMSRLPVL